MSNYPTSDPTDQSLYIAVNNAETALSAGIDNSVTTIPVYTAAVFAADGIIGIGTEAIHYTGKTATTFTGCTRGFDGTAAAAHAMDDQVVATVAAAQHNNPKDEIIAMAIDLRNCIKEELDDSISPATAAATLRARIDQIVTQLKLITGEADWKTAPDSTVSALKSQQDTNVTDITTNAADIDILNQNIRNIIGNGSMEVWQRGTSFINPVSATVAADLWLTVKAASVLPTVDYTRDSTAANVDSGTHAMKVDCTNAGSGRSDGVYLEQSLSEMASQYRGKSVTISCRIKTTSTKYRIALADGVNPQVLSSFSSGSGAYETLSITLGVAATANVLIVDVGMIKAADVEISTAYIDSVMMVVGDQAIGFVAEDKYTELARCQRYYEATATDIRSSALGISDGTNYYRDIPIQYHVEKKAAPTVTLTISKVQEEGSAVDQKASYTSAIVGSSVDGFSAEVFKAIAGNKPSEVRFTYTAAV